MLTPVHLSLPLFICACLHMFIHVYSCLPMFTDVYNFTHASLAMFTMFIRI